jgi:hypothetical protein
MPIAVIAKRLGVSVRTVEYDWRRGIGKLKRIPGAFELLLDFVHASAASDQELLRAGSAECRTEFVNEWGGTRERA